MKPSGTIYNSQDRSSYGEIKLAFSFAKRFSYHFIRGIGAGLIAFVVIMFAFSFGPIINQEVNYSLRSGNDVKEPAVNMVDIAEAERIVAVQKEADSYGVNSQFSVFVPKIDAASDIIPNVDTADKQEYADALMNGVAHAKGTYFPGQGKNIFLFAHSTDSPLNIARYNAVFYLLRKLETGDKIIVFFADAKYVYEVSDKQVVSSDDTSWITDNQDEEKLLLMTCDPPGTIWNRLIVTAVPVE
jgi:LPXTG-site transpeptidase (sortase) family protein